MAAAGVLGPIRSAFDPHTLVATRNHQYRFARLNIPEAAAAAAALLETWLASFPLIGDLLMLPLHLIVHGVKMSL